MKSVLLEPDGLLYSIPELEERIPFKFLPCITFESFEDQADILGRGLAKLQSNLVSPQALELGQKYFEKINAAYIPHVSVRWISDKVGYGLFTEEEISEGNYV